MTKLTKKTAIVAEKRQVCSSEADDDEDEDEDEEETGGDSESSR